MFRRIPSPVHLLLGFPTAEYLFTRQTSAPEAVITSTSQKKKKKHVMTSHWYWHWSANLGSTPFSVWSSAWRRRIRWQESSVGYPLKFICCSMMAFAVSYPCRGFNAFHYSHDPCSSYHAYAHLSYVPMLAFWVFHISGYPLFRDLSTVFFFEFPSPSNHLQSSLHSPSPLVVVVNFSSRFVLFVPLKLFPQINPMF